jgi:hypothetical protein
MAKGFKIDLSKATELVNKTVENAAPIIKKVGDEATSAYSSTKEFAKNSVIPGVKNAKDKVVDATGKVTGSAKEKVVKALDANGDGTIGVDDIIIHALRIPGCRVDRKVFLIKEFTKNHNSKQIEDIIKNNPAHAGITQEEVDKIADEVIKYERYCVSGISTVLGTGGGLAMAATIPADIVQYYSYMLRAAQKLMYLYGFPEIKISNNEGAGLDTETVNILTICLGVMYGVAGASNALKVVAQGLAKGVEKQLLKKALTKGTIYPIVKAVAKWFDVKMTKEVFAGFFKKSIPVIGGVIGGTITYASFKPCCDKLKESLKNTMLSNPNMKMDEIIDAEIIDDQVSE